ncbi:Mut7-C RNAse domain-containing protein [Halorutilales archaeon Cl-col2-1]
MTRFFTDVMLGKLTTYLRMVGHDTVYALEIDAEDDDSIRRHLSDDDRTLLTRDIQLSESVSPSVLIESRDIEDQLREVYETGIELELDEPERCSVCNSVVEETGETPDRDCVPSEVETVWRCTGCGKLYWKGSHWDDVSETLERVKSET